MWWYCVFSLQRGNNLKAAAASNYVIKETATGALLLNASGIEIIQFSPLNIMNGAAQMEAR